jgi:hypothetical protein
VEKNVLFAAGKENTGVISKSVPFLNKGSVVILFKEPIHIHSGLGVGI